MEGSHSSYLGILASDAGFSPSFLGIYCHLITYTHCVSVLKIGKRLVSPWDAGNLVPIYIGSVARTRQKFLVECPVFFPHHGLVIAVHGRVQFLSFPPGGEDAEFFPDFRWGMTSHLLF